MEQLDGATSGQIVVYFDHQYAPCCFLICRILDDEGHYDPCSDDTADTFLVQSDWDYPGTASSFGWSPCDCGYTDGTVNCDHKTATQMITDAYDYLESIDGCKAVDDPGYFNS